MFTGIITHLGKITNKTDSRLKIETQKDFTRRVKIGTSIAVNGVCLTVVSLARNGFSIDFMPETARKTNIQYLANSDLVNLELPVTPQSFLAGHILQGHVDAVGNIMKVETQGNSRIFTISVPFGINKYIVEKGSIAVNGISLTVIETSDHHFTVGIIPHTWKKTMLHKARVGDYINLEVDVLAKYVEKLMAKSK